MYHVTFRHYPLPADDTSLYTLVYKCIHSGIMHRVKTKSKYKVAEQSYYLRV